MTAKSDPNVNSLLETKSKRTQGSKQPQQGGKSDAERKSRGMAAPATIDPSKFIHASCSCADPDPRNPGRALIRTKNCLLAAFGDGLPPRNKALNEILAEMEAAVIAACSESAIGFPDQDALRRAWDEWYEFMIAAEVWNMSLDFSGSNGGRMVRLPGVRELRLVDLFARPVRERIEALEAKLASADAALITSNPNFIFVPLPDDETITGEFSRPIHACTLESYDMVMHAYGRLMGRCERIRAAIGLKSFARPGRDLQIPYEASILKALCRYLTPAGERGDGGCEMRYYVLTSFEIKAAEEQVFRAAASHCISDADSLTPQRAVDRVLHGGTLAEASGALRPVLQA
ncbi:MAG TPA: Cfr10I/Bse634I family restriction endonuclease [Terriglobales bacterium]|nr:Cfr10I/Bse634I family restriction endonuclease [Terriglobales bacterium]